MDPNTSAPKPTQVAQAKRLIEAGWRQEFRNNRVYWCRTCGAEETGSMVPRGWYSLTRHTAVPDRPYVRLGLFCSIDCLSQQMTRFAGIANDVGDKFDESPYQLSRRDVVNFPTREE